MSEFNDKVVVITGGNSGIGRAIAKRFSQEGANVVLFGRDLQKLEATEAELKTNILSVQGDVRNISDLTMLFAKASEKFGKIDTVVANAGIASRNAFEVDEAFFDDMIGTNLKGVFFTVQSAVEHLNNPASIVLISSITGHVAHRNLSLYSATKAAVSHLARCFASDLAVSGVRVNAISPGYTMTPIFDTQIAREPNYINETTEKIPLGRFAHPQEIADAALYLASQNAAYITGTDLVIDGGVSVIRH